MIKVYFSQVLWDSLSLASSGLCYIRRSRNYKREVGTSVLGAVLQTQKALSPLGMRRQWLYSSMGREKVDRKTTEVGVC